LAPPDSRKAALAADLISDACAAQARHPQRQCAAVRPRFNSSPGSTNRRGRSGVT